MLRGLEALNSFGKAWQNLKGISNDSVISGFKERRLGIGIDDNNDFRTIDARKVLNGTRNAGCNV